MPAGQGRIAGLRPEDQVIAPEVAKETLAPMVLPWIVDRVDSSPGHVSRCRLVFVKLAGISVEGNDLY
jgi:hypothetical protein